MDKKVLPISVLIPTMNRPNALRRTINSYMEAPYIPAQIVVVDQSENTDDAKEIEDFLDCIGGVYYFQKIPSSTKARNNAMAFASEEILVFSDDDVDVYPNTLKNVYDIMIGSTVAMIAGLDDNQEKGTSKLGYLLGTKSFINRKIGHVTMSMLGRFPVSLAQETDTQWAMGFFFAVKKSLLDNWGVLWDEKLLSYAYAEDLDFSYSYYKHAMKENYRCILTPNVHVKHLASKEYRVPSRKSTFMYVLHRYYLSRKHNMGLKSVLAMRWCNFWMFISRKGQSKHDMYDAMIYLKKHQKETENGIFPF